MTRSQSGAERNTAPFGHSSVRPGEEEEDVAQVLSAGIRLVESMLDCYARRDANGLQALLHEELSSTFGTRVGYLLSRQAFRRFRRRVDSSEHGGAPLVGLNGLCIVGHGRSSAKAVRNGVAMAARFVSEGLIEQLARQVASTAPEGHVQ